MLAFYQSGSQSSCFAFMRWGLPASRTCIDSQILLRLARFIKKSKPPKRHKYSRQLPDYPSFPLAADETLYPIDLPENHAHEYHQCARCSAPSVAPAEDDMMAVDAPADEPNVQHAFGEDARLVLGTNVSFTIGPEDELFSAQEVVDALTRTPVDSDAPATTVVIPKNKVSELVKALKEYIDRPSQQVVERDGYVAFWKKNEPFIRPVLRRSLSLP
ncbi:hypothetical protein DFH11DRAFT_13076 [Phellopilus nigrolimitatus]|nr:hypothetical protein DFH11DRAFT_13076 [Phellopilus nigrolimitatus]